MAERVARHLSDRLGEDAVTAHHGSLSKEKRLDAETRLKAGALKALVATASLELGIDIGHVDLVCQIGSPHRIATLLQRVGRSGHTIAGTAEGAAVPDVARRSGRMRGAAARDRAAASSIAIVSHDAPLDVLAQQIVAETRLRASTARTSCSRWCPRRLAVSASCARSDFDAVVDDGCATGSRRGAAGARRWCIATKSTAVSAAGAARGCWRSPPAARFPKSPTTAWSSSPRTRSSAR